MRRNSIWMILLLLCMVLFSGCGADTLENDEDIWVIAEEISYNEQGEATIRNVYTYEDQYNYRIDNSEGERSPRYKEVTQSKDGRQKTEAWYSEKELLIATEYQYDKHGRLLSERTEDMGGGEREYLWNWNADGTIAEVYSDDQLIRTETYDAQGRKIYSVDAQSETEITYTEQERVLRGAALDGSRTDYVVNKYDEQQRIVETYNYLVYGTEPYTEEDLTAYTAITYEEDGHSYWLHGTFDDGEVRMESATHVIYKPLSEMIQ